MRQTIEQTAAQYAAQMDALNRACAKAWRIDAADPTATEAWARVSVLADGADVLRRKIERARQRKAMRASIEGSASRAFWKLQSITPAHGRERRTHTRSN